MNARKPLRRTGVALTLALGSIGLAWAGAACYEALSSSGPNAMEACNPTNSSSVDKCRVTSLPGESNFNLVASRSQPVIINGITVGTQQERVYRRPGTNLYIFGVRLQMNADQWDETGAAFNVNDVFRQVRTDKDVEVAYNVANAGARALKRAGRSFAGLNEEEQGERNNAWVDFRIDANAGEGSAWSPWLLTKTRAPEGYALQDFALRLLNSENEAVDQNSIYALGYQPVCTEEECAPEEEEEEEA